VGYSNTIIVKFDIVSFSDIVTTASYVSSAHYVPDLNSFIANASIFRSLGMLAYALHIHMTVRTTPIKSGYGILNWR
jgi:hypothetical protein